MNFHVKTLRKAESDIRKITNWIAERSPQGAEAWLSAYDSVRTRLANDPESCSAAEENEHFEIHVQQALFKTHGGRTYRALFTIMNGEVRILRIRGPGQATVQPEEI